ncbi:hypothetical protein CGRA01v4_07980 [Colletotrichum graminicola]|nr:hypothetical protein CGRA01v4_07980 [Colletotrichum graminicola]
MKFKTAALLFSAALVAPKVGICSQGWQPSRINTGSYGIYGHPLHLQPAWGPFSKRQFLRKIYGRASRPHLRDNYKHRVCNRRRPEVESLPKHEF